MAAAFTGRLVWLAFFSDDLERVKEIKKKFMKKEKKEKKEKKRQKNDGATNFVAVMTIIVTLAFFANIIRLNHKIAQTEKNLEICNFQKNENIPKQI